MENIELNLEEIYLELKNVAQEQGALTRGEWEDLIDEFLEEKRGAGEINDDDDWEAMRESLINRYEELEEVVSEM